MSRKIISHSDILEYVPYNSGDDSFGYLLKVYNDGSHYVGTNIFQSSHKKNSIIQSKNTYIDSLFDTIYFDAVKQGLRYNALKLHLISELKKEYPLLQNIEKYVEEKLKQKLHNFYSRLKRFKRKANLNKWNYFVTLTYDSKKMDADSFRFKVRKCLSNLHCRRNWKYMGVFELSPEENRLHFHALMYIPDGEMVGEIVEETSYSTKKKQMQTAHINSFFAKRFGRNDFSALSENDLKFGHAVEYITKYLNKTNERILYSRDIPSEFAMYVYKDDIASEYHDFLMKYVLFDDVIDNLYVKTIKGYRHIKYVKGTQLSLFSG